MIALFHRQAREPQAATAQPNATTAPAMARRRRTVAIVTVALIVLASVGVLASQWIKSPQQLAADAAPPSRSVLTASVTSTVVKSTVVMRGTVGASAPVSIPVPQAAAASSGDKASASRTIVSATPVPVGGHVNAGTVAIELSGRPVIVLPGAVPAYRDLRPGDQGPDVVQLQKALASLGLFSGQASGTFGSETKNAITALYRRVGYEVPATSGLGDPPDSTVTQAQAALTQAQRALQDAQAAASSGAVPQASTGAGGSTDAGSSGGAKATDGGSGGTADSATTIQRAQQDVATAQQAYDQAVAASGPMMPMSEVAFLPSLPASVVSLGAGVGGTPQNTLITFDVGQPVVSAKVDATQSGSLRTGMSAELRDDSTNYSTTATISAISKPAADAASGSQQVTITLRPTATLPDAEMGADLQVSVDQASSNGKVLAVPIAAITARADNSTYVTRRDADGSQTQVSVTTGVVGEGLVQITPIDPSALKAGDKVVTSQ